MTMLGADRFLYVVPLYHFIRMVQDRDKTQLRRKLFWNSIYYLMIANAIRFVGLLIIITVTIA